MLPLLALIQTSVMSSEEDRIHNFELEGGIPQRKTNNPLGCSVPSSSSPEAFRVDTQAHRPEAWSLSKEGPAETIQALELMIYNHNRSATGCKVVALPQSQAGRGLGYLSSVMVNDVHQKISPNRSESIPIDIPCESVVIAEGWDLGRGGWINGEWDRKAFQVIDRVSREILCEGTSVHCLAHLRFMSKAQTV